MADFSANAASLQPAQGVGGPVVTPKIAMPAQDFGSAFSALSGMIGKGVDSYMNAEMIKTKNAILGNISQEQASINNAVASGQMSPQEAHTRSMAAYNKNLAAYPQLASEITGLNAAFKATTETGDTDKIVQNRMDEQQKIRTEENSQAISQGFHISPDMSDAQRGAIISASQAAVQARTQLKDQQAQFDFDKSRQTWSQDQEDRQRKFGAISMVADLAGKNMDAFDATLASLQADVKANRRSPEEAAQILQSQFGNISGVIQAAAGVNADLASPYRSIFESKYQLGLKLLDPKSNTDALQREYNDGVTRQKLMLFNTDPVVQKTVAASQMLGTNNPILSALIPQATTHAFASIINSPTSNGAPSTFVQPVVGNPQVEKDTLNALKYGIDQLRGGKYADKMAANSEGSNAINNLLVQTGQMMNQGTDASRLKGMADFFASSQYAYMMQNGHIDQAANQAAKMTFQRIYEPAVVQAVGNRMTDSIAGTDLKALNAIDANFTAAGVQFTPRKGLSDADAKATQAYIDQNLKSSAMGMNTALRVGSHMEGSTDYQKYWNENKYILMPQLYPVKPGQTVNGMQWSGDGDWRDPSTWKRKDGGKQ